MPTLSRNISHGRVVPLTDIAANVRQLGDLPGWPVARQLDLLEAVADSDLGAFILIHGGLDAYWTDVVVGHQTGDPYTSTTETLLLERLPAAVATRQRFAIFRDLLQRELGPGMTLASMPCGTMTDLLSLDYRYAPGARLVGIDLDADALATAGQRAARRGLPASLHHGCAWEVELPEAVDIMVCHGLSIYEPDTARLQALYQRCTAALKPGGLLVSSFMTPPPTLNPASPWRMAMLDPADLMLQHILFTRLARANWTAWRTHEQTAELLQAAGLTGVAFHDDSACLFPTVTARRARA